MLQTSTVAKSTLRLLKNLQAEPLLADTRLVGGTALSLQIGHRESEDLDLFTTDPFDGLQVQSLLIEKFGDIDEDLIPSIKMPGYQFDFEAIKSRVVKMTDYPDKIYITPPLKKWR